MAFSRRNDNADTSAFRAVDSFAVSGPGGAPRMIVEGHVVGPDDPLLKSHGHLFKPIEDFVEQATAGPGELRNTHIPRGDEMPHALPPEDPRSPASSFAPAQPAAGVVADDADEKGQNLAGGPKASEASGKKLDEAVDAHTGDHEPATGEAGSDDETSNSSPKPAKSAAKGRGGSQKSG